MAQKQITKGLCNCNFLLAPSLKKHAGMAEWVSHAISASNYICTASLASQACIVNCYVDDLRVTMHSKSLHISRPF